MPPHTHNKHLVHHHHYVQEPCPLAIMPDHAQPARLQAKVSRAIIILACSSSSSARRRPSLHLLLHAERLHKHLVHLLHASLLTLSFLPIPKRQEP